MISVIAYLRNLSSHKNFIYPVQSDACDCSKFASWRYVSCEVRYNKCQIIGKEKGLMTLWLGCYFQCNIYFCIKSMFIWCIFEAWAVNTLSIIVTIASFICVVCILSFTHQETLNLVVNVFHYIVFMSHNNRCCCVFKFWQVFMEAKNTYTIMFTPSLNYCAFQLAALPV